jgi:hypothetical protein
VVFEMLTGRKAWPTGGDGPDLCRPLADAGLPARWRPLLRSLFSLDPSGRPATLGEIERLLPSSAAGPSTAVLFASGAVLLAVLAGLCLAIWKSGPGPVAPTDKEPTSPVAVTSPVNVSTDAGKIPILKARRVFPGLISAQSSALGSVSPGGETAALLGEGNRVLLCSSSDGSEKVGFESKTAPLGLALSGPLLAIARFDQTASIYDAVTGQQVASFEADPKGPIAWAGASADRLLLRTKAGMVVAAKEKPNEPWKMSVIDQFVSKQAGIQFVVAVAPQRGTDLFAAGFINHSLVVYDLKAERVLLTSYLAGVETHSAPPRVIAWGDSRTITVVADRKVTEHEIGHKVKDVALWELPASAKALAWLGPDEYAMVHDAGEKGMEVSLGRRAKRVFHAKLDTGGAWIERLEWIAASRTLAAYGRDGSVRLYAIPDRNKN